MGYNFYFETEEDACLFIYRALEIAKKYGRVTLADLYDLAGMFSNYTDSTRCWTASSIVNRVYASFNSISKLHVVSFPEPDFHKNSPNKNKTCISTKSYITKKEPTATKGVIHCKDCIHCFTCRRSRTGYSCAVWGYDDFSCDVPLNGYCHKAVSRDICPDHIV